MEQGKGWHPVDGEKAPDFTAVDIEENGIRYTVDFENGQKTGFFLDQKYNRQAVAKLARGRTVLDCFTPHRLLCPERCTGRSQARHGGGRVGVRRGVCQGKRPAQRAFRRDGVRGGQCVRPTSPTGAAAQAVRLHHSGSPAFTKSRKTTQRAMTGYKEINYRAMRLLPRGGYLATCSCSHFATEELFFLKMLRSAAKDAGVQLRQIEARQQCCDHPILWGVEETNYLKFYLFQVV